MLALMRVRSSCGPGCWLGAGMPVAAGTLSQMLPPWSSSWCAARGFLWALGTKLQHDKPPVFLPDCQVLEWQQHCWDWETQCHQNPKGVPGCWMEGAAFHFWRLVNEFRTRCPQFWWNVLLARLKTLVFGRDTVTCRRLPFASVFDWLREGMETKCLLVDHAVWYQEARVGGVCPTQHQGF